MVKPEERGGGRRGRWGCCAGLAGVARALWCFGDGTREVVEKEPSEVVRAGGRVPAKEESQKRRKRG